MKSVGLGASKQDVKSKGAGIPTTERAPSSLQRAIPCDQRTSVCMAKLPGIRHTRNYLVVGFTPLDNITKVR